MVCKGYNDKIMTKLIINELDNCDNDYNESDHDVFNEKSDE